METLHLTLGLALFAVLALGPISELVKDRTSITEPLIALGLGVLFGPFALGVIDLSKLGDPHAILLETARFTVGVSVMATAMRLPTGWLWRHWRAVTAALALGMPAMWLASAALAFAILGYELWPALLLGAVLTPTDPVLAGTIVSSELAEKRIPGGPRHLLPAEAGANDGLTLPLVAVPILMIEGAADPWREFVIGTLLREIGLGVVFGLAVGVGAGLVSRLADRERLEDPSAQLPTTIAMAIVAVGFGRALGLDGILSAFVAGLAFSEMQDPSVNDAQSRFDKSAKRLIELPAFVLLGLAAPLAAWREQGWLLALLGLALFALRRPPHSC